MTEINGEDMREIVRNGYNLGKYAKYFGRNDKLNNFEKIYFDILVEKLPKNSNILDLGCGTGLPYDLYLADKGHKITGIDLAENHVLTAQKNVKTGTFITGDYTKHKFDNGSFDAVVALYSLFHIPREEHQAVIAMIYDYLRAADALLLITTGVEDTGGTEIDYDFCGNVKMAWSGYGADKYIELLESNGFEILKSDNEADFGGSDEQLWILARKI
ncbi:MAG TPA: class I SAM-dependent methyltransferase [Spirochaetota bacterium]|nr:class I SAM-dependent methyltransferase [Spirochaetota bacterium]